MLPRSLFSASSLKSGQTAGSNESSSSRNNNNNNAGTTTGEPSLQPISQTTHRSAFTSVVRRHQGAESSSSAANGSASRRVKTEPSSLDVYSSTMFAQEVDDSSERDELSSEDELQDDDNDDGQLSGANLQELMLLLQKQQSKQQRYLEKTRILSSQMEKTSMQIARIMGLAVNRETVDMPSPAVRRTAQAVKTPSRPLQLAKRTGGAPIDQPPAKMQRQYARRTGPPANPRPPSAATGSSSNGSAGGTPVGCLDVCDLFLYRNQDVRAVVFAKKPRSLLFNVAEPGSGLEDLLVASSLKGDIQFWDVNSRRCVKTIEPEMLYTDTWVEDICWATPSTMALCSSHSKQGDLRAKGSNDRVLLVHLNANERSGPDFRIQRLPDNPHDGCIDVLTALPPREINSSGSERFSLVTAGTDKSLYLWDLSRSAADGNFSTNDVMKLPSNHTNAIQALCYTPYYGTLFSGGADGRLLLYDVEKVTVSEDTKFGARINNILRSPNDPNLIMINLSQSTNQFVIYDQRVPGKRGMLLQFGFTETENLSRYIRPDWHQNGYTVASGSHSESKVHFWDIRYTGATRGPCFSFTSYSGGGQSRILRTLFLPNQDTLVTLSSTRNITWIDYSIQHNSTISSSI